MSRLVTFRALVIALVLLFVSGCAGDSAKQSSPASIEERVIKTIAATQAPLLAITATSHLLASPLPTATIVQLPTSTVPPVFQLCSPLKDISLQELPGIISDPYHPPPMGKDDRHQGVDFSFYRRGERESIAGLEIQAVLPGRVAAAVSDTFPFGNMVIVETPGKDLPEALRRQFSIADGESLYILYAHMQAPPEVRLGDVVETCQVIGLVGKTGNAGVAHLHLEMRHGVEGVRFPVMAYYLAKNTPEERQNYLRWATSGEFLHFDPMELLSWQP